MPYVRELAVHNVRYRITQLAEINQACKWSEMKERFDKAAEVSAGAFANMHVQLDPSGQYIELIGVDVIGKDDPSKE